MASVSEIVNQITEQLSEGVSQLTLLVLRNKEANAAIPANLPPAVEGVIRACGVLAMVAKQLAAKDYVEYPRIQKKLNKSALVLEESNVNLNASLKQLSLMDRIQGWQTLNDSCRTIAEKTSLLLQVVYGASILKLLECSEQTLEHFAAVRHALDNVHVAPRSLVHWAGQAATLTDKMAQFARARVGEEQSPFLKSLLSAEAEILQGKADAIISSVNKVLASPMDKAARENLLEVLRSAEESIGKIAEPMRAKLLDETDFASKIVDNDEVLLTADALEALLPSLLLSAKKMQSKSSDAQTQAEYNALLESIKDEVRAIGISSGVGSDQKKNIDLLIARLLPTNGVPFDCTDLLKNAQALSDSLAALISHAKTAKPKKVITDDEAAELDILLNGLTTQARDSKLVTRDSINNLLEDLGKLTAITRRASIRLDQSPEIEEALPMDASLEQIAQNLGQQASKAKSSNNGPRSQHISSTCESIAVDLSKLAEASKSGKPSDMLEAARDIAKQLSAITIDTMALAKDTSDPKLQDKLIRNTQALKNLSIQLKILAAVSASSPEPSKDNKMVAMASLIGRMLGETMSSAKAAEITVKK